MKLHLEEESEESIASSAKVTMDPMIGEIEREESCLKDLKGRIKGDKELSEVSSLFDDNFLLIFVRSRKCDPKKAFETLQNYIQVRRTKHKDLFKSLIPSLIRWDVDIIKVFRNRDEKGRISGILRIEDWDPDEVSAEEYFQMGVLYLETALAESQDVQRNGVNLMLDTKNFSIKHAKQITPFLVKNLVSIFWGSFPIKYNQIFVVNSPMSFSMVYNMFKHFLPLKIRQRLQLYSSDLSKFHKHFSPDILPDWLDGKLSDKEAFDHDFSHKIKLRERHYVNMKEKLYKR